MPNNILLIGTLPPELGSRNFGGVAQVVWSLAKALKPNTLVTIGAAGFYYGGDKEVEGISLQGINFRPDNILLVLKIALRNHRRFFSRSPKNILRLTVALLIIKRISELKLFDCVLVHHIHNQVPFAVKLLKLDIPVIATIHSYHGVIMSRSRLQKRRNISILNEQMEFVDYLIHVSYSVRNQGKALGILWNCPNTIIYNGLDFLHIQQHSGQIKQICFVGSLIRRKGVLDLIEALKYIDTSTRIDQMLWLGSGELKKDIEAAAHYSFETKILGYLEHQMAIEQMAQSSLLVVPSISESFGLVYIESLYVGTPVIGFHGSINEFRDLFDLGSAFDDWMIPFDAATENPKELAEKIKTAMNIKGRPNYEKERQTLQKTIEEHFSWEKIALQYRDICEEAIINWRN